MNFADFTESAVSAKTALYEYLALPDAATIVSRIRPADSASEAAKLIQDAEKEAWRIRFEMAKGWSDDVIARVAKLLDAELSTIPFVVRPIHPVTGPLMLARYPEGALAKMTEPALIIWQQEQEKEEKEKKETARNNRKPARSKGGKNGTESRERGLMIRCVRGYLKSVKDRGQSICLESSKHFSTPEKITDARLRELLGTLITAFEHASTHDEILITLKANGFPNATQEAVVECMAILKKSASG